MHPNLMSSTNQTGVNRDSDRMTASQILLLVGVWAALFAVGAVLMG